MGEIGIAEIEGAIVIGTTHRLDHHVDARRLIHLAQIIRLQDLPLPPRQCHPMTAAAHGGDFPAMPIELDRRAFLDAIGGEFLPVQ